MSRDHQSPFCTPPCNFCQESIGHFCMKKSDLFWLFHDFSPSFYEVNQYYFDIFAVDQNFQIAFSHDYSVLKVIFLCCIVTYIRFSDYHLVLRAIFLPFLVMSVVTCIPVRETGLVYRTNPPYFTHTSYKHSSFHSLLYYSHAFSK